MGGVSFAWFISEENYTEFSLLLCTAINLHRIPPEIKQSSCASQTWQMQKSNKCLSWSDIQYLTFHTLN